VLYQLSYGLAGAGVEARAGRVNSERATPTAGVARPRRGVDPAAALRPRWPAFGLRAQ
jgi:hypothetical protein